MTDQKLRPLGECSDEEIIAIVRAKLEGRCQVYHFGMWVDANNTLIHMDYAYRLAPEPERPMSPPWEVLPEWAKWAAQDKDGAVFVFDEIPKPDNTQWASTGSEFKRITFLRFDKGNTPWDRSLVQRPENKK